jgi:hypothetical protein
VIDGRTLKCLTVVDEFTREGLTIHCATSLTSSDVVAVLAELIVQHGRPVCIRSDNVLHNEVKHSTDNSLPSTVISTIREQKRINQQAASAG